MVFARRKVNDVRVGATIVLLLLSALTGCDSSSSSEPPAVRTLPATTDSRSPREGDSTTGATDVSACDERRLPFARQKLPRKFFPTNASALWAPSSAKRCLYLVPPGGSPRPIWQVPVGERLVRLGWAPDGTTFVATTASGAGTGTYFVDRDGFARERLAADGITFLDDGSAIVVRRVALYLRAHGRERRLVALDAIRAAAGFGRAALVSVAPDRHGFARGYGADAVVTTVFSNGSPSAAQALVLVSRAGSVQRVGPIFGSARTGNPGGRDWSADGDAFVQVVGELPGSARLNLGHDHCLDVWTARGGYRRLVCGSDLPQRASSPGRRPHFDRVVWSADGSAFLLNNGAVVTRSGAPLEPTTPAGPRRS
ncbi:MAG TPA: hypothetical protein VNJ04_08700 [Gemmatimonadaceae bacterium]|nr:hypothetical protein [Gemmatimonadaceae bacterium]